MASKGVKEAVVYPALRSAITGLFACLLAWISLRLMGWSNAWTISCLVGALAALLSWLAVVVPNKKIVQRVGESKIYPTTTKIQITASDPAGQFSAGRWAELPITTGLLQRVAKRLAAGASFSHAGLAGPGRPLSRSEYEVLRDEFIARGLAYWRDPASHSQGVELSRAGVAVLRYFAGGNDTVTPLPQLPEKRTPVRFLPGAAHAHRNTSGKAGALWDKADNKTRGGGDRKSEEYHRGNSHSDLVSAVDAGFKGSREEGLLRD